MDEIYKKVAKYRLFMLYLHYLHLTLLIIAQ